MAFAQIDAITRERFLPKLEDNILDDAPTLRYMFQEARFYNGGGRKLVVPVKFAKNTAGGSYGRGDKFDVSHVTTRATLEFDWKSIYQSLVIFGIDVAMNKGEESVIDHVATSMDEAHSDLADKMSTQLFADGTGNSSKNLLGLAAAVDDGTNVATYGGKTRATDTWAQGGYTASVGTLQVSDLQAGYRDARSGNKAPNLIVTTETIFDTIEGFATPTLQNQVSVRTAVPNRTSGDSGLQGQLGFTELHYKGVPVIADEYCTSGVLFFLNTKKIGMHVLKNQKLGGSKKMGFAMTPMKQPVDQDGDVAQILWYGELVSTEPRASHQLNGIT